MSSSGPFFSFFLFFLGFIVLVDWILMGCAQDNPLQPLD